MGTTFYGNIRSKKQMIAEIIRDYQPTDTHETRHGLWAIIPTPNDDSIIVMFKIEASSYGYGFKPISEDMGPCFYDCPESFFDKQPKSWGRYADAWRANVKGIEQ